MGGKRLDLTGQTFGRLVVLEFAGIVAHGRTSWLTRCSCGAQKVISGVHLTAGSIRSCGCLNRELASARLSKSVRTHGMNNTPTRKIWSAMWTRCTNPREPSYKNYGGRGITVCERWKKFESFYSDMGERPPGMSLDRIDNDKGYSPDNCRWATYTEQAQNRRNNLLIEHNGETQCLAEWARRLGVDPTTIKKRFVNGGPIDQPSQAARAKAGRA